MQNLCTKEDHFLEDRSMWVAILSDDTKIYADDNRPGCEPASAWLRLTAYLKSSKLKIIKFGIKFRDHYEWLPDNCDGYFFVNGVLGALFSDKTLSYQILGYVENDKIICRYYSIPALLVRETTIRDLKDSPSLFMNKE